MSKCASIILNKQLHGSVFAAPLTAVLTSCPVPLTPRKEHILHRQIRRPPPRGRGGGPPHRRGVPPPPPTTALRPAISGTMPTRRATVRQLLEEAAGRFPGARFRIGVCGSGGRPIAAALGVHYVQGGGGQRGGNPGAIPQVRTAVELGGQDAKVIFFHYDEAAGRLQTSDMRMNGSCAGGTGAFIDEIAALLNVPPDDFEKLAAAGKDGLQHLRPVRRVCQDRHPASADPGGGAGGYRAVRTSTPSPSRPSAACPRGWS